MQSPPHPPVSWMGHFTLQTQWQAQRYRHLLINLCAFPLSNHDPSSHVLLLFLLIITKPITLLAFSSHGAPGASHLEILTSSRLLTFYSFNNSQEHFTQTKDKHEKTLENQFIRDEAHYHGQLDAELPISQRLCANEGSYANPNKRSRYDTRSDRKCCRSSFFCPLLVIGDFCTTATWLW